MAEVYVGQIIAVGFNWRPSGFAYANGQLLGVQQNAALFSLYGVIYGGDGSSTFGIPDLRSRAPVGIYTPSNSQKPFSLTPYQIAQMVGQETVTLTTAQMPNHTHSSMVTSGGAASTNASFNASQLAATTTINALTAPTTTVAVPTGNMLTVGVTGGTGPVPLKSYAAPANGTPTTMASGMATTTFPNSPVAVAATTTVPLPAVSIGATGGNSPFSVMSPITAINYVVAITGIYPNRD